MIVKRWDQGVSLTELLVTITVTWIVMVLIVQSFYQMREQNIRSVETLHTHTEAVEADNIFRNLIDGAYISGNATYSFWKLSSFQISSGSQINPLDYPIIYAQREPLTTGFPSDAQAGTDILVVQTIDDPQVLTTAIISGASSFTRPADGAPAITASKYMLLSSESYQNLITAASDVASGTTTINLATAINQNFPAGATLYTDYIVRIIYIAEETDNQGNVENDLVQLNYDGTGNPIRTTLLSGVSDLQIRYNIGAGWQRVTANDPDRLWYKQIRGLEFSYNLNGQNHQVIVAFGGIGDNTIPAA
ncbi:hypothetical protein [Francisella uliginis]|uniref:Uncharacterized protein n=1 Tax=Francisella uliginis TaxID=573570 RepID=A0A1L4BUV1_9GAMM|nr:hypothetical protein [Francisella uliginis]API87622.1 hypothetical protein F7310_09760 [Francisella uliginis]